MGGTLYDAVSACACCGAPLPEDIGPLVSPMILGGPHVQPGDPCLVICCTPVCMVLLGESWDRAINAGRKVAVKPGGVATRYDDGGVGLASAGMRADCGGDE